MKVVSVNVSEEKGTPKVPVESIELAVDLGIRGDAHAGPGKRQVSLLAQESYDRFEKSGASRLCLKHGAFGENIVTEGIVLHKLQVGQLLKIGSAVLEISKIGKECHAPCRIAKIVGRCIMPEEGVFAKVMQVGEITPGMKIKVTI